jgi:glycerophosphoryl diester phosphodiesterase
VKTVRSPYPAAEGRPLVLGHRGASADAPENTMAAFRLALEQGADGFELDVWRCGSGEVVVAHDEDGLRVAGSPLRPPVDPWSRLRAIDVGVWRGERFRGERIPLLEEVLEAFPSAVVNVEMKAAGRPDLALAREVARIVREARAGERVVVSSFSPRLLAAFGRRDPEVARGWLVAPGRAWRLRAALGARWVRAHALHPGRSLVTPERAAAWRAAGLRLAVWTVDDPAEVERLARLGATAVISNRPGIAREAVRRATGR